MKNKKLFGTLFAAVFTCTIAVAHADDGLKVTAEAAENEHGIALSMTVSEEVEEVNMVGNKIIRLVDADSIVPGDRLVYVTTVKNRSQQSAENVAIVNPVPEHTTYLEGSAQGDSATVTFSVDGAKNFDSEKNLTVTDENGDRRAATTTDYTHIRWVLNSLPAKAEADVLFRARLN
ncbi:MAG: hypothetical protein L3J89_07725 [Gammaproteobacteria bacterium]|nr:hypothetical protein [Gammaproteobacteria bacterium]